MNNLPHIEKTFREFIQNLDKYLPDGIFEVNLELLQNFDLLDFKPGLSQNDDGLTKYFHVVESIEKITLINEEYVIWIVPDFSRGVPSTYTLIATQEENGPHLETGFISSGVYNNSTLVLRVLEKVLQDIAETQSVIKKYEKSA
ncbi:MAG: hypothetical protein Tsb0021_17160 [Chlamydiales bacterium]